MGFLLPIALVVALLGAVGTTIHLLLCYRRPPAAVAWLFALWILPIAGPLLYLSFSAYDGPRKVRRRKQLSRELRTSQERASQFEADLEPTTLLARVAERAQALPMTDGNLVELHGNGVEARAAYLEAIRSAETEIMVQTYIWTTDDFTEEVIDLLLARQNEGLRVRVLIDPIGSRTTKGKGLLRLTQEGIASSHFLAPSPLKGRLQVNSRNHRKLLVVDGKQALVGGRNMADVFFQEGGAGKRDLSLSITGPAARVLRRVFDEDWMVATGSQTSDMDSLPIPYMVGETSVRVIPHGCDEPRDAYIPIVSAGLRSARESILIVTPYFVPGPELLHDLRMAALSGVLVRVLVPERSPERWPDLAARRFFEPLLHAGVEFWIRPAPFLHAKAIVVDGEWAVVGSANFDQRSFHLNYETSCEISDPALAAELESYFEPDFALANKLDPEAFLARGWRERLVENGAALFAPIL